MKLFNVDVDAFQKLMASCKGTVTMITEDGDRLVTNSMLSALVGFSAILSVAEAKEIDIECEDPEDKARVLEFMMQYRSDRK